MARRRKDQALNGSSPRSDHPFSENPDFDYEIRGILGQAVGGAADVGEVLAATAGIGKRDHVGWFRAWHELGQRTAEAAQAAAAAGHRFSAASAFLRASAYLGTAVNAVSSLEDSAELIPTFREQQAAWDSFITATPMNVQRIDIPYEKSPMPGWFFRPAQAPAVTPTIVLVNGSDGSLAALWDQLGRPRSNADTTCCSSTVPGSSHSSSSTMCRSDRTGSTCSRPS